MEIKNIVVIGGGVLGSQIAYQAAYCGFDVTIWLRSEGSIGRCQPKLDHLKEIYHDTITLMDSDKGKTPQNWAMGISDYEDFDKEQCLEKANKAYENIKLELDLQKAVSDADLIIESMAENVEQKIDIYKKMADLLPEKTVIVTINHRRITDTLSEAKKRTETTRQREQSGTAERISRTAHPKHRQKLLLKHRRNRRTNSRINRRAEAPANVDVKVQPDSRSFRWADWNRSE